jgi:UDP-N-acetylmuramate dehydrogenase
MKHLYNNYSIKEYNTFGIDVKAKYFFEFTEIEELTTLLENQEFRKLQKLVIGGGSNLLFTKDFDGLVIYPQIKGIKIINETDNEIYINAGAGNDWDSFVEYCVSNGYGGTENLSLIPGNIGASPVQNIGAYGVEVKDIIDTVEALNIETNKIETLTNSDCKFGYRNSAFKNKLKGKYIITGVTFKLYKKPKFTTHYGSVDEKLKEYTEINISNIRKIIIDIRDSKLPDHKKIGNAGSFFKNPVIDKSKAESLKLKYPTMPLYHVNEKHSKLAAGWLIEQCGWKGKRIADAGVHKDQSLVLVNHGNASGNDIIKLANKIIASIKSEFDVDLEMEVNII